MKPNKHNVIVVPSGRLVEEKGKWRITNFKEANASFALSDRLRVVAAAALYEQSKKANTAITIWASGGKGQLAKIPGVPTVASVIKSELEVLRVPAEAIETEEHSGTTYQQILKLDKVLSQRKGGNVALVSNEYHLPRIKTIIKYAPGLANLKNNLQSGRLVLLSAEEVLADKEEWQDLIREAHKSATIKERINIEKKGVLEIRARVYRFNKSSYDH